MGSNNGAIAKLAERSGRPVDLKIASAERAYILLILPVEFSQRVITLDREVKSWRSRTSGKVWNRRRERVLILGAARRGTFTLFQRLLS